MTETAPDPPETEVAPTPRIGEDTYIGLQDMNTIKNGSHANGKQSVVLGMGTGRCGLHILADLLDHQPGVRATASEPPLLPWRPISVAPGIAERFRRLRRTRKVPIVADAAPFYLPYIEQAIALEPGIRIIGLERPREEVVASFCRWLDAECPLPTDHWSDHPCPGWHHDPVWARSFPQYQCPNREGGIRLYWEEYHATARDLAIRYPENVRIFPATETLGTAAGRREILSFAGIPGDRQVLAEIPARRDGLTGIHPRRSSLATAGPQDPRRCVVLVPHQGLIVPSCEESLRELERRGYAVWRIGGYAAIDQGRSQLATDALVQGFEETMWIDSDVGFDPDAVDRLRSHNEPIVCGIYPMKGRKMLSCHVLPGTPRLVFGEQGGLAEILYAAGGFLLVRRMVYMDILRRLDLPLCNESFGQPLIPFFQAALRPHSEGVWYLADDFAFCERARQCGYRVMADTTIRLWHYGSYPYGWEEAGIESARYATFNLGLS